MSGCLVGCSWLPTQNFNRGINRHQTSVTRQHLGAVPKHLQRRTGLKTYGSVVEHARNKHGVPVTSLKGTFLYEESKRELNLKRRERYQKAVKRDNADSEGGTTVALKVEPALKKQYQQELGSLQGDKAVLKHADGTVYHDPDGSFYKGFWVKFKPDGNLSIPISLCHLTFAGDAECVAAAAEASAPDAASAQAKPPASSTWSDRLPVVCIKAAYTSTEPPEPSTKGGRTPPWPVQLECHAGLFDDYKKFLTSDKAFGQANIGDHLRGLCRVFDMITVNGEPMTTSLVANDPAVLVSIYMNNLHRDIFSMGLMSPACTWTRKALEGLKSYCTWQLAEVSKMMLKSDDPSKQKFKTSIEQLLSDLNSGISKRVNKDKKSRQLQRRTDDALRLQELPSIKDMKGAVTQAMTELYCIGKTYVGTDSMPPGIAACATRLMIGIIWLNGFAGRKMEWALMLADHFRDQMAKGLDFLICDVHKTSHVYGSLAKWLAPGTIEALKIYLALPWQDGETDKLLRNADGSNISKLLKSFGQKYFSNACALPTVNLLRKWYHTELCKMTRTEESLLRLLKIVDAHSVPVAKQFYVLKVPADDAKLARALVLAMIGEPVPWPTEADMALIDGEAVYQLVLASAAQEPGEEDNEEDDDDEDIADDELEWVEGMQIWGLQSPSLALTDAPGCSEPASSSAGPELAAQGSKRRYEYIKSEGRFQKVDPRPNLLNVKPAEDSKQPTVGDVVAKVVSRMPSIMTDAERAWLENEAPKTSHGTIMVPVPKGVVKLIYEKGTSSGALTSGISFEGLRSHFRKVGEQQQRALAAKQSAATKQKAARGTASRSCRGRRPAKGETDAPELADANEQGEDVD